jgi:hypothetical protein
LCRILRYHELDYGKCVSCWNLFYSASFTVPTYEQLQNLNVAPVAAAAAAAATAAASAASAATAVGGDRNDNNDEKY